MASASRSPTRCRRRMEVEVARGQKLYRQTYTRGTPDGPLKSLGRGQEPPRHARCASRPTPRSSARAAAFKPARLFRMARSKAYLFRGVEIRWSCAKALLAGDSDTPESAVFHFPGGLKDFLDRPHRRPGDRHQGCVRRPHREDRRLGLGRMGDRLDRQRRRFLEFLLQHRADAPTAARMRRACARRSPRACAAMASSPAISASRR